uniref:Erythrocyte membrane protein band 4.1 like 3 n=1 Tax=Oryzias sinensis TaxID=183150 RepID=A0A8C7ZL13_9TELE
MTTESGSESKQPQENREAEKSKAAEEQTSPQNQPEKFPAAAGHSTPAKREQVSAQSFPRLEDQVSHRSSSSRLSKSPLRGVRKVKIMQCKVALLDGSDYTVDVEKRAKGQILFSKICEHLNLLEKDYFGITYKDTDNQKNWLDPSKELKKQIRNGPWNFAFNVKFYPPDPSQLSEDITRYYLCLQLRDDVVSGRLPCSFATHTVLGSYTVQSELGDYDPEEMASDYVSELRLAPNQTKELEEKVMELHKNYKGMTPAEAEMHFLENAKKLSMYGVDLHHAKDSEGVEIMLGVCASGLLIYRDKLRINRFAWPKILKISYKRNNFYIKIRPGEFEQFESTIGFKLPNHRAAKRLWKVCVEHHTFFRLVSPEAPQKKFLSLGSKFRYSGRTQAQTRRASSQIIRPAPFFERTSSKRYNMSRSLDGGDIIRSIWVLLVFFPACPLDWFVLRKQTDSERTDFAFDGDITVTEDTEPLPEVAKHQTNISELKRSFLETAGSSTPGPTEWEKRLSSSPLRSPRSDEAPMIEPLEPQDVSGRRRHDGMVVRHDVTKETGGKQWEQCWTGLQGGLEEQMRMSGSCRFLLSLQVSPGTSGLLLVAVLHRLKDVAAVVCHRCLLCTKSSSAFITFSWLFLRQADTNGDADPGVLLSAQTITSETTSTTTTTHITKTVKGGISETRIEKRIVITGDADIDHDEALAQAIKEAKEQHPDMSVTKVVVHKETEITPEGED